MSAVPSDLSVKRSALNVERSGAAGPAAVDSQNPWLGLDSFTEETRAFFHGRDEEVAELTRRVQRKPLTVLFGQSGLGKTSILRAGVVPRLRAEGCCPVYVRLDYGRESPRPSVQIKRAILGALSVSSRERERVENETLWEFLHHREDGWCDAAGRPLIPLLIFDQFEEIFTLGQSDDAGRQRAAEFTDELADLVENRAPRALEARLENDDSIVERFDFGRADYRILISLREDYLPHLEGLKARMPSVTQNRMRLAPMNGKQALEAVIKPGGALVTEEVARAIVEFVAGARGGSIERLAELHVEPPLLSVICRELNDRRRALGQPQLTADLVTGNRREILTDFYERSVADVPAEMRAFVEDHLLTKSGFRDNLALETALEFPGVTKPLIDLLVSRRLLRLEDRLGVQRVELTHDVLAEVIRGSRDTRQQRLALEKERQRERLTRRRMWLARTIAAGLLVGLTGTSWIAWRAIRAESEQARLRADADTARSRERVLREQAQVDELAARQKAYASDMIVAQEKLANNNPGRALELLNRQRPQAGHRDLRGWEWRYLWLQCQSDPHGVLDDGKEFVNLPSGRDGSIWSLAVSPDGKLAATGARYDGRLVVWDLVSQKKLALLKAGIGAVRVAFSPRDALLAFTDIATPVGSNITGTVRSRRSTLRFWDAATRQMVAGDGTIEGECVGLAFSADGRVLVTAAGGPDSRVDLWRVSDKTKLASHSFGPWDFSGGVAGTPFAATADLSLVAVGPGTRIKLIDLTSGKERWTAEAADESVKSLALSPDGKLLASGGGFVESTIRLWDIASGREIKRLEGHGVWVSAMAFFPDGKTLASASADRTIRLWNLSDLTTVPPPRVLRGHTAEIWRLAVLPDSTTLVSADKGGAVYLWDAGIIARRQSTRITLPAKVVTWRFSPDSRSLFTVDLQGQVAQWTGAEFQEMRPVTKIGERSARSIEISPDGRLLAAGSSGGSLQVWDLQSGAMLRELEVATGEVAPRGFLVREKSVLIAYPDDTLHEWDLISWREKRSWRSFDVFRSELVQALESASAKPNLTVELSPALSPDGKRLAVTGIGQARVLDALTRRELARFPGFLQTTHSVAFSPDATRLAVGSGGKETMKLWDVESGQEVLNLAGEGSLFYESAFSPDGSVLGSRNARGVLHLWRAPSWAEIEAAELKDGGRPEGRGFEF